MTTFIDVALGADPGRWPLPTAVTAEELWLRAVAAGGQGRYAAAVADLEALTRLQSRGRAASLAASTRGSFLRQLGGHDSARTWDGSAFALAGPDVDAAADALIGLAADALGVGRFAASSTLLRCAEQLVGRERADRIPVRLAWVSAELAMARGHGAAVEHAERAVALAAPTGSARHVVKSQVVLAAALCSVGALEAARVVADAALVDAERLGLIPLSWALASLLADIGSTALAPAEIVAARDAFAAEVRHRGGRWTAR